MGGDAARGHPSHITIGACQPNPRAAVVRRSLTTGTRISVGTAPLGGFYHSSVERRRVAELDPDDGQQAAMQETDLFTKHPSDNEQRLDQHGHIGEVLHELLDARLKLNRTRAQSLFSLIPLAAM